MRDIKDDSNPMKKVIAIKFPSIKIKTIYKFDKL